MTIKSVYIWLTLIMTEGGGGGKYDLTYEIKVRVHQFRNFWYLVSPNAHIEYLEYFFTLKVKIYYYFKLLERIHLCASSLLMYKP